MKQITEITRRDVFDVLILEHVNWAGRLEETEFLSRIYDLKSIPSTDTRFHDSAGDIWQHRVNNYDWKDDWIFSDDRFGLLDGDDEIFLRFLCEIIHPVVCPDTKESQRICQLFNKCLNSDGFEIVEKTKLK